MRAQICVGVCACMRTGRLALMARCVYVCVCVCVLLRVAVAQTLKMELLPLSRQIALRPDAHLWGVCEWKTETRTHTHTHTHTGRHTKTEEFSYITLDSYLYRHGHSTDSLIHPRLHLLLSASCRRHHLSASHNDITSLHNDITFPRRRSSAVSPTGWQHRHRLRRGSIYSFIVDDDLLFLFTVTRLWASAPAEEG